MRLHFGLNSRRSFNRRCSLSFFLIGFDGFVVFFYDDGVLLIAIQLIACDALISSLECRAQLGGSLFAVHLLDHREDAILVLVGYHKAFLLPHVT